ncbi:MAG: ACT domain-containing protein [Oscillospiraceae bacterium]|nr:ACT domain-containing protein [Oscillospiraceae bacterium]
MLKNIIDIIENVKISPDITLITLYNTDVSNREKIFRKLAENNINLDIISQSPWFGGDITLSFSLSDKDLPKTLEVMADLSFKPEINISSNNLTISFFGSEIINTPGIAADIFEGFSQNGINIVLIATSDISVSCLIAKSDEVKAMKMLHEYNFIN